MPVRSAAERCPHSGEGEAPNCARWGRLPSRQRTSSRSLPTVSNNASKLRVFHQIPSGPPRMPASFRWEPAVAWQRGGAKITVATKIVHSESTILGPGGLLSRVLPGYEPRPQQLAMAELVSSSLRRGVHLLVEAGTGIGKSFAYLVPAALFVATLDDGPGGAEESGSERSAGADTSDSHRIVISTRTIALQEQLFQKDIPALLTALGGQVPIQATMVKGRGNYLCLRRFLTNTDVSQIRHHPTIEENDAVLLANWLKKNPQQLADRSLIPFPISPSLWETICCEVDSCPGRRCPHCDACHLFRARREQEKAGLLITNHALFFADLALRRSGFQGIFPSYSACIFDEGHHLEAAATAAFTVHLSLARISGLLETTNRFLDGKEGDETVAEATAGLRHTATGLEKAAVGFFTRLPAELGLETYPGGREAKLLREEVLSTPLFLTELGDLREALASLEHCLSLSDVQEADLTALKTRWGKLQEELIFSRELAEADRHIHWAEGILQGTQASLHYAPLRVDELLAEALFASAPAIITSATLAAGENLDYLASILGVSDYTGRVFDSPFDYENQTLLYLPAKAPQPDSPAYVPFLAREIGRLTTASSGRAMVLFTAYSTLKEVHRQLRAELPSGFTLLRQGDAPPPQLLQAFREAKSPVLLATDSFWEGVDIRGDALSLVVITRFPFTPPNDPITAGRLEHLRRTGGNPFREYSLPRAAIKLKQGFGRLIRSSEDRGVVAILDSRALSKSYGTYLLRSLPPAGRTSTLAEVESFFAGKPPA